MTSKIPPGFYRERTGKHHLARVEKVTAHTTVGFSALAAGFGVDA
jgi:hypothetical protein